MRKIVLFSHRSFGGALASIGIRHLELARVAVAEGFLFTIVCRSFDHRRAAEGLSFAEYATGSPEIERVVDESDIVMIDSNHDIDDYPSVTGKPLVLDLPCPTPYEYLETEHIPWAYGRSLENMNKSLSRADVTLVSNPRQEALIRGCMLALNRHNPANYKNDVTLGRLVRMVPFGHPSESFPDAEGSLKGKIAGVEKDDVVGLWNGSIMEWYDPECLIRAFASIHERAPRMKLVIPFDENLPEGKGHPKGLAAVELAKELGLYGKKIFFVGWVPYEERTGYLVDADFGVFASLNNVETYYSSRTRVLDLLWRGVPAVQTEGDYYGELTKERGYGATVPPGGVAAMAEALLAASDERWREERKENIRRDSGMFTWRAAAAPLLDYLRAPYTAADKREWKAGASSGLDGFHDNGSVRRVVIFGASGGGLKAMELADACRWEVAWFADNNAALWGTAFHGLEVRPPDSLREGGFDLIIIASIPGMASISAQLGEMGLERGRDYIFLTDTVRLSRRAAI